MAKVDDILLEKLAKPLATHLLTLWVGPVIGKVGGDVFDLGLSMFREVRSRKDAERLMSGMADSIIHQLVPLFEREINVFQNVSIEAIANELSETLKGMVNSELIVAREIDPVKVAAAFRVHRALPPGQFSGAEVSLYERSLDEVARYLVEIASQLPRFKEAEVKAQLQLLHGLQSSLESLLESVRKISENVQSNAPHNDYLRFEAAYRQAVVRNVDQLELFGVEVHHSLRR